MLLAIFVRVAFAERSFSKLKLIKSCLRSTMLQERLSGFAILSIEKEMSEELKYKNLVILHLKKKKKKKFNKNCGDQLSLEYYWGCMDWAIGPMTRCEDASKSEDGQLR